MTKAQEYVTRQRYAIFNTLVMLCLAVFASAVGVLYFWMFDSRVPVEVHAAYPIEPEFPLGTPIVIEERLDIHKQCQGSVYRSIIDGAGISYPIMLPSDPLLGAATERLRIEFQMPQHLGPGRYRYRAEASWQCNPMRTVRQTIADVPFVVGPAPVEEAE